MANHENSASRLLSNQSKLPLYKYEPLLSLGSIRVLCLESADNETQPLQGHIFQIDRETELAKPTARQAYSAVSYAWGKGSFCQKMLLKSKDSTNANAYLPITENVRTMLVQFRRPHKHRYLWIDAICLNQKDESEKSEQIPLMGEIYKQADKVFFWLGTADGDDIGQVFVIFRLLTASPNRDKIALSFNNAEKNHPEVIKFLRRPFWFRRWILQEKFLATLGIMCCGQHSMPYSLFLSACRLLQIHLPDVYAIQISLSLLQPAHNISSALWDFHQSVCSDKKDRIAALYGLIPLKNQFHLDYKQSYQEIYRQHAVSLAHSIDQRFDLLLHLFHFGALQSEYVSSFPSWIPDWSQKRTPNILCSMICDHSKIKDHRMQYEKSDIKRVETALAGIAIHQTTVSYNRGFPLYLERWKEILKAQEYRFPTPTVFWLCEDERKVQFLNVSWTTQRYGKYGLPIRNVFSIPYDYTPQGSSTDSLTTMKALWASLQKHRADMYGHREILALIYRLLVKSRAKSLKFWTFNRWPYIVMVAMIRIIGIEGDEADKLVKLIFPSGSPKLSHFDLNRVLDLMTELGYIMHELKFALFEIGEEPRSRYILGPSHLDRTMSIIPMDNPLLDRKDPFWTTVCRRITSTFNVYLISAMVVKPLPDERIRIPLAETTRVEPSFEKLISPESQTVLPIKATYVGNCAVAANIPWSGLALEYAEDSRSLLESYGQHQTNGWPPPYMISIV